MERLIVDPTTQFFFLGNLPHNSCWKCFLTRYHLDLYVLRNPMLCLTSVLGYDSRVPFYPI
uniref:Uncharacterized protein n=1 Tax=Arundo donax TaxID=35708 RepID=A0A0A9FML0_ARUDO